MIEDNPDDACLMANVECAITSVERVATGDADTRYRIAMDEWPYVAYVAAENIPRGLERSRQRSQYQLFDVLIHQHQGVAEAEDIQLVGDLQIADPSTN